MPPQIILQNAPINESTEKIVDDHWDRIKARFGFRASDIETTSKEVSRSVWDIEPDKTISEMSIAIWTKNPDGVREIVIEYTRTREGIYEIYQVWYLDDSSDDISLIV